MNLLIVNDEQITANAIKNNTNWGNYEITSVQVAYDAKEARDILLCQPVDILLCDIEMPGEDGIDLLRWVREQNMDVDCIFLTCHTDFKYAQEGIKLGCVDYVVLPVPSQEIADAVYKVVNRRKTNRSEEKLKEYGKQWIHKQTDTAVQERGEKKSAGQIVEECKRFIWNNLDNAELAVNDVADFCHLNSVYLNRLFKKECSTSISQYIISEKMHLAAKLLDENKLNAYTVAERVGYPNYPHFSSTFKKHFGCSPKQYAERKQV